MELLLLESQYTPLAGLEILEYNTAADTIQKVQCIFLTFLQRPGSDVTCGVNILSNHLTL